MRRFMLCFAAITGLLGSLMVAPADAASASDGKIAFVRGGQIWTVTKTGGSARQLTTVGSNTRPKFSPDGKRIAYLRETAAGVDVWVMYADGHRQARRTSGGDVTAAAVWSPDGRTLAYGKAGQVVLGTSTALIRKPFPIGIPVDRFLAWSRTGSLAVFNHETDSPDDAIHVISSPGTAAQSDSIVAETGGECCGFADWSDLMFSPSGVLGYSEVDHCDVTFTDCFVDPPASDRVGVIFPGFRTLQGDRSGVVSPSGSLMAFVSVPAGVPLIYTATVTGDKRRVIVSDGSQPDWQPRP